MLSRQRDPLHASARWPVDPIGLLTRTCSLGWPATRSEPMIMESMVPVIQVEGERWWRVGGWLAHRRSREIHGGGGKGRLQRRSAVSARGLGQKELPGIIHHDNHSMVWRTRSSKQGIQRDRKGAKRRVWRAGGARFMKGLRL